MSGHEFTVDEVVGANVRTLREVAGLTQSDLAARLTVLGTDWTASNVSLIEAGKRKLTLTALGDLCRVFGFPTPALFGTHDADGATAMRLTAMGGTDTATLTATPAVAVDQDAAAIVILRLAERRAVRRARRTMEGAP